MYLVRSWQPCLPRRSIWRCVQALQNAYPYRAIPRRTTVPSRSLSTEIAPIIEDREDVWRLLKQDPYDRISVVIETDVFLEAMGQSRTSDNLRDRFWDRIRGNPLSVQDQKTDQLPRNIRSQIDWVQKELIPFWVFDAQFKYIVIDQYKGRSSSHVTGEWIARIGGSVASVGPDHWCHNVVLPSNSIAELADYSRLGKIKPVPLEIGVTFAGVPPDQVGKNPFAGNPPQFTPRGLERILDSQDDRPNQADGLHQYHRVKGTPVNFALPTYRLVYKVSLNDGSTYFMDSIDYGFFRVPQEDFSWDHGVELNDWKGYASLGSPMASVRSPPGPYLFVQKDGKTTHQGDFLIVKDAQDPARKVYPEVVREALTAGMGPINWMNERIFPFKPPWDSDQNTSDLVARYLNKRRWDPPKQPVYRPKRGSTKSEPSSSESRSQPSSSPKPSSQPRPRSSARPEPSSTVPRELRPPRQTTETGPSRSRSPLEAAPRTRTTAGQQQAPPRPRRSTTPPPSPEPPKPEQPPLPTYGPDVVLHDSDGHYSHIGLTMDRTFLDPKHEAECNMKIKANWLKLTIVSHPDIPGGSNDKFIPVNEAYLALKTLRNRCNYQDRVKVRNT